MFLVGIEYLLYTVQAINSKAPRFAGLWKGEVNSVVGGDNPWAD